MPQRLSQSAATYFKLTALQNNWAVVADQPSHRSHSNSFWRTVLKSTGYHLQFNLTVGQNAMSRVLKAQAAQDPNSLWTMTCSKSCPEIDTCPSKTSVYFLLNYYLTAGYTTLNHPNPDSKNLTRPLSTSKTTNSFNITPDHLPMGHNMQDPWNPP